MAFKKPTSQTKLLETLDRYRPITELHPVVNSLGLNPGFKKEFERVIRHESDVISSRSPELDDHEITINQKAFVILMQDEETHHAAARLYVEELLGVGPSNAEDAKLKIQNAVHVRAAFLDATSYAESRSPGAPRDDGTKLARLEFLCERAKADLKTSHPSRYDRANAARFLRDTVENTINYIHLNRIATSDQASRQDCEEKLKALDKTYEEASTVAKQACFGKSRSFEERPVNNEPLRTLHRARPFKRGATEPRRSSPSSVKHSQSSQSRYFPSATPSRNDIRRRRSASPRHTFDSKPASYRRLRPMQGDYYRPA